MDNHLKKFFPEPPYSIEVFKKLVDIYLGSKMVVAIPKGGIYLPNGTHAHSSYEFVIPWSPILAKVEKKQYNLEISKLIPFNSEQCHGMARATSDCRFCAFQIEKQFFDEICYSIYGRTEVIFANQSIDWDKANQDLIQLFMQELEQQQAGYTFITDSLSTQIVINLLRQLKTNMSEPSRERRYTERENINRVIDFFMEYYNKEYSLAEVAKLANLSTYHFIRTFKTETGKTPYDYLLEIKITKAGELLRQKKRTITEISYLCGFSNPSHFTRVFKMKMGVTPSQYQKSFF